MLVSSSWSILIQFENGARFSNLSNIPRTADWSRDVRSSKATPTERVVHRSRLSELLNSSARDTFDAHRRFKSTSRPKFLIVQGSARKFDDINDVLDIAIEFAKVLELVPVRSRSVGVWFLNRELEHCEILSFVELDSEIEFDGQKSSNQWVRDAPSLSNIR